MLCPRPPPPPSSAQAQPQDRFPWASPPPPHPLHRGIRGVYRSVHSVHTVRGCVSWGLVPLCNPPPPRPLQCAVPLGPLPQTHRARPSGKRGGTALQSTPPPCPLCHWGSLCCCPPPPPDRRAPELKSCTIPPSPVMARHAPPSMYRPTPPCPPPPPPPTGGGLPGHSAPRHAGRAPGVARPGPGRLCPRNPLPKRRAPPDVFAHTNAMGRCLVRWGDRPCALGTGGRPRPCLSASPIPPPPGEVGRAFFKMVGASF